jgi:formate hydrogenlyase subunit 3/multisubunit Na+/H+ antiporter MnhD subunit
MDITPWAVWTIVLPLLAAILAILCERRLSPWLELLTAGGIVVAVACLTLQVGQQGIWRHTIGGWGVPLGIDLRADGLSTLMLAMTAVVGAVTSVYALAYFAHSHDRRPTSTFFWPLWFLLWAGLNALFLSADIFNLYVTLELLGLAAVALVALDGTPAALTAAMRYLLVGLLGSLLYLFGVALLYSAYATLDISELSQAMVMASSPFSWSPLALMSLGLILKTALFPMHFWLPPAHANAPAPVSALLSALVVKASFYLLLRLWFELFPAAAMGMAKQLLGVLGAVAILWGSLQALRQQRLKLLVAYSTVAQIGYLFLLFPLSTETAAQTAAWSGSLYFAVSHACAKAAVFMAAGTIMHALGHDRLDQLEGIGLSLPMTMFAFALAGVSLMGLPPSGGFAAKWLLLDAALDSRQWWIVCIIIVGGLLAAGYVFRVLKPALTTCAAGHLTLPVPRSMEWAALLLAVIALLLGLFAAQPLALLQIGSPFATF